MLKMAKKKKKKKKKVGRPTNYEKELVKRTKQYLVDYKKDEAVPTIAGLALYLEIHRDSIYEYEKNYKEFSDITEMIRALQEKRLLTGGLLSKYNSIIARLMLAKHGYKEQQETTIKGELSVLLKEIEEGGRK